MPLLTPLQRINKSMQYEEKIRSYNIKLNSQKLFGPQRQQELNKLIDKFDEDDGPPIYCFDDIHYIHTNTKGREYLKNMCKYKRMYAEYMVINKKLKFHRFNKAKSDEDQENWIVKPFITMQDYEQIACALDSEEGSIPHLKMFGDKMESNILDLVNDLVEVKDCPTLYPFDLRRAKHYSYRLWYLEQKDEIVVRHPHKDKDGPQYCYRIIDLMAFYSHRDFNRPKENIRLYDLIRDQHAAIFEELKEAGKIVTFAVQAKKEKPSFYASSSGSETESLNDYSNELVEEYMLFNDFELYFLRFMQSTFAKKLFARLFPTQTHGVAYNKDLKRNVEVRLPTSAPKANHVAPVPQSVAREPEVVVNQMSIEEVVKEFVTELEEKHNIVGYFYNEPTGKERTFYELFKLTTVVTGITSDLSGKWTKAWKLSEIKPGYVIKPEGSKSWFVTAEHFLIFCMSRFKQEHLNEFGKDLDRKLQVSVNFADYPIIAITSDGMLINRNNKTTYTYALEEAIGKVTSLQYLKGYFEYQMAKMGYLRRVYGDQNNLYEAKHIVHVAGPYTTVGQASESAESYQTSNFSRPSNSTSRGHVTLQVQNSKGEKKETLFLSIDYFIKNVFKDIGNGVTCVLANAFRASGGQTHQLYLNGSSQIVTGAMENSRQIMEEGTDQDRNDRALTLQSLEPEFANFIDTNNEAHHIRTVTDEIPLELVAGSSAVVLRDTEMYRSMTAKEQRLAIEAQEITKQEIEKSKQLADAEKTKQEHERSKQLADAEKTKQVSKEAIEKTKQVVNENTSKTKMAYHELMGIRSHEKAETEREKLRVEAQTATKIRELDDAKRLHEKDFQLKEQRFLFEQLKWKHENGYHVVEVQVPAVRPVSNKTARRSVSPDETHASSARDMLPPKYRKKTHSTNMRK